MSFKIFVALALAKYLSRPETDFTKTKSQFLAAAIALFPAAITILQSETGLGLRVFLFFYCDVPRGSLPSSCSSWVCRCCSTNSATIVIEPNILALVLTGIAALVIYALSRQIKRNRRLLFMILLIWALCVGVLWFAVPYIFKNVLQKHQVERIYDLFGKDNPYEPVKEGVNAQDLKKKKESGTSYNVRQSKIAIGSGRFLERGYWNATQTRYDFVPEQRTDFIFCTVGEGFGFTRGMVLLVYTHSIIPDRDHCRKTKKAHLAVVMPMVWRPYFSFILRSILPWRSDWHLWSVSRCLLSPMRYFVTHLYHHAFYPDPSGCRPANGFALIRWTRASPHLFYYLFGSRHLWSL